MTKTHVERAIQFTKDLISYICNPQNQSMSPTVQLYFQRFLRKHECAFTWFEIYNIVSNWRETGRMLRDEEPAHKGRKRRPTRAVRRRTKPIGYGWTSAGALKPLNITDLALLAREKLANKPKNAMKLRSTTTAMRYVVNQRSVKINDRRVMRRGFGWTREDFEQVPDIDDLSLFGSDTETESISPDNLE